MYIFKHGRDEYEIDDRSFNREEEDYIHDAEWVYIVLGEEEQIIKWADTMERQYSAYAVWTEEEELLVFSWDELDFKLADVLDVRLEEIQRD